MGCGKDALRQPSALVLIFVCRALRLDPRKDWVEIWVVEGESIDVMPDMIRQLKEWKDLTHVAIDAVEQTGRDSVGDNPTVVREEEEIKKEKGREIKPLVCCLEFGFHEGQSRESMW